jgi:glycosyltransferase involved in cell wall biosynthesis
MSIYFLTPDYDFPSGGVRIIYRHVDILNKHGIPACVLHRKPGHRATWFDNQTPVAYLDTSLQRKLRFKLRDRFHPGRPREWFLLGQGDKCIGQDDILVLPEIYSPQDILAMAPGVPKVILNQGCYLTFQQYPIDQNNLLTVYRHPDIRGVLTNSQEGIDYLRYVFPELAVGRFHPSIDTELFQYQATKKRRVCFTTRKNELIMRQVINILKFRGALDDFELLPFAGISQLEVAKIFMESALYLSFATYEGFGLPPAEAMACGCVVIGFHGGGGREFFLPEFSYPIENSDVIGFAATVERVLQEYRENPAAIAAKGRAAAEFIREHYPPQREEADVVAYWRGLLDA